MAQSDGFPCTNAQKKNHKKKRNNIIIATKEGSGQSMKLDDNGNYENERKTGWNLVGVLRWATYQILLHELCDFFPWNQTTENSLRCSSKYCGGVSFWKWRSRHRRTFISEHCSRLLQVPTTFGNKIIHAGLQFMSDVINILYVRRATEQKTKRLAQLLCMRQTRPYY